MLKTRIYRIFVSVALVLTTSVLFAPLGLCASVDPPVLAMLSLSSGSLSPSFEANTTSYSAVVPSNLISVLVFASAENGSDTVTVNGSDASGGAPVEVPLSLSGCSATVVVSDGVQQTAYMIAIAVQKGTAPSLASLSVSPGSLSPSFFSGTHSYSASVGTAAGITVIPSAADSSQSITVNGAPVQNGASSYLPLSVGDNTVMITVASGGNSVSYSVDVTRDADSSGNGGNGTGSNGTGGNGSGGNGTGDNGSGSGSFVGLQSLSLSTGTLSPAFNPNTTSYTAQVTVASVSISCAASDPSDAVTVNGSALQSGAPYTLPLDVGDTTVNIMVYSGSTFANYTITITRTPGTAAAGLSSLSVSPGTLSPAFSTGTSSYTVNVSAQNILMTASAADPSQAVTINGTPEQNGTPVSVSLNMGANTVTVAVTASTGTKTYTLNVTRLAADVLSLSALSLSDGTLSPSFSPNTLSYSAQMQSGDEKVSVYAAAADATSKVKINGGTDISVVLNPGPNTVIVTVTAADNTSRNYTVMITRQYENTVSVDTPDTNGGYTAAVPDYVPQLDSSGSVTFAFGSDSIQVASPTLKGDYGTGGLSLSEEPTPQNVFTQAYVNSPADSVALTAKDITLFGGTSSAGCTLNARVTFKFSGDVTAQLKTGVPAVYFYNPATGTFTDTDATFDLSSGTAVFKAQLCGTYLAAVQLPGAAIDYSLSASSNYQQNGSTKSFNARVTRTKGSDKLSQAQIMVVTTLANGSQTLTFAPVTGDDCIIPVTVNGNAKESEVYLICSKFDGTQMPHTYALASFVES